MEATTKRQIAAAAFAAATASTAALSTMASPRPTSRWFRDLRKPPFQPPPWVFGPVWSALYATIAASGYRTWRADRSPQRIRALALWGTQLCLNGAWSPLFFRKQNPKGALVDSTLLLSTTAAYVATTRKVDRGAHLLVVPYFAWLGFATVLNAEIVRLNPAR